MSSTDWTPLYTGYFLGIKFEQAKAFREKNHQHQVIPSRYDTGGYDPFSIH